MAVYSIKELEHLSGIKAHTIRIWEKRYQLIKPRRTPSNIRYYTDPDLKKLLNIALLNHHGYKISKIAALSYEELQRKVTQIETERTDFETRIELLTLCMIALDECRFEELLSEFIQEHGFENTMVHIIFPFLKKIGILWLSDSISPIQEHFISNLVRQKIIVAIDALKSSKRATGKKVMLFLPENELHEIGLLFCNYILKTLGLHTIYLGQWVPLSDLELAYSQIKPDYLISVLSNRMSHVEVGEFITLFSKKFHKAELYFSGQPLLQSDTLLPKNVHLFNSMEELKKIFSTEECDK